MMFDVEDRYVWNVSLCARWQVGNWMSTVFLSALPQIGEVTSVLDASSHCLSLSNYVGAHRPVFSKDVILILQ